jgi:hypothetical protein
MSATEQTAVQPAVGPEAPDDANDLRGYYFRRLLDRTGVRLAIGAAAIVGFAVGTPLGGPLIGAAGFAGLALGAVLVVFGIADSRAENAFFADYCSRRGMFLYGKERLPEATPLLCKGDDRYAERAMKGPLGESVEGTLALFVYEETHASGQGGTETDYYRYTIGLTRVPECTGFVPELYCRRKFGPHALEKFEDVFHRSYQRVELESAALDERYEIFVAKEQDATWMRRLFSPTFIVWLTDSAPEKFAFELVDGTLCCYVNDYRKKAKELDAIRSATATVAGRLRDEATE